MNNANIEQLKLINAKLILGLPLNSFEQAYYTLYGGKLTEAN